jgi:hypothetical protein
MTHKLVRLLAVLGIATALVAVPAAAHAAGAGTQASTQDASPQHALLFVNGLPTHCTVPLLDLGYGISVAQCTQISGIFGRPGIYNAANGQFSSSSPYFQVANANWFSRYVCATDNVCGNVGGFGVLATPYGAAIWVHQYVGNQARWGAWNLHTNLFYPSSGWLNVV